jgi:membrane protease YdiL (CAAX protease family)
MRWREVLPGFLAVFAVFQLAAIMLGSMRGEWGLAVAAIVVGALATIEMAERQKRLPAALGALGFGQPRGSGLTASLLISLVLLAIVPAYIVIAGADWHLYPGWVALLPGLFAQGGIAEEALFRGFLFGRLHKGRSFWRAAFLATLPFLVAHLYLFATMPFPVALASVLLSTIISFPLAKLFDAGGGTIWGPALVHFVVQATPKIVETDAMFPIIWIAAAAVVPFLAFAWRAAAVASSSSVAALPLARG